MLCLQCILVCTPCCVRYSMNSLWPDEPLTPSHEYAVSTETVNSSSACPLVMRTNKVHAAILIAHIYLYKWFITLHTAARKKQEDCISYKFTLIQLVNGASLKVSRGGCISFEILIPA